jgi:hypothetical protein
MRGEGCTREKDRQGSAMERCQGKGGVYERRYGLEGKGRIMKRRSSCVSFSVESE